jgi:N4-gp56 family major capsid protein
MPNELITGMQWSKAGWQRDYYQLLLLETLRTKSILMPFCAVKRDYQGAKSGTIIYTEVYDTEPNWNGLSEQDIWLRGAHLDSRTVNIQLEIHGDVLKFSDYSEVVQYVNRGDMAGLVQNKIGQNQTDYLDILARNAFLTHPNKTFAGGKADRASLTASDLFDPDLAELIRTHLEENEVPGVASPQDGGGEVIVCGTTPRVIHDIRTAAGSAWIDVQNYNQTGRKFTNEAGMWGGVRFVKTNRLRLRNHGAVDQQTTLTADANAGDGAAATVDVVYSPGQASSTRYITVADETGFAVGDWITLHDQNVGSPGDPPVESDGSQETRRIVEIDAANNRLALHKPLLKNHLTGDYVTTGLDVHTSIFFGGPGVVYGIGEDPHVIQPPKFDDLMMVNRYGWRGFLKFQMFRPEFFEVVESAGTTD